MFSCDEPIEVALKDARKGGGVFSGDGFLGAAEDVAHVVGF